MKNPNYSQLHKLSILGFKVPIKLVSWSFDDILLDTIATKNNSTFTAFLGDDTGSSPNIALVIKHDDDFKSYFEFLQWYNDIKRGNDRFSEVVINFYGNSSNAVGTMLFKGCFPNKISGFEIDYQNPIETVNKNYYVTLVTNSFDIT